MNNQRAKTDLLIIIPPSTTRNTIWPPYGAMYIVSALRRRGYNPSILNVDTERINNDEVIETIKRIDPDYIGFSGLVATRYKYIKELSHSVKRAFPNKIQILGGALSSAAEVILSNTPIDIVVYGEGDVTIVELLECLNNKGDLNNVLGIYYDHKFTGKRPVISNIDTLDYPAFNTIDMDKYLPSGIEMIRNFTTKKLDKRIYDKTRNPKLINILTGRGCIGECSFCVRQNRGLRMRSIKYVFDYIEYCIEKFGVGFFSFGDECFAANKERNWEFINEYKRRNLDIVFRILGMRVDTVDREMLHAFKEIGCWMIEYGFESGSQKMLNVIDKRVSVELNKEVANWTHEAGIYTSPQFIVGMPGETNETIDESIEFLKSLDFYEFKQYKCTYALPIPGSPLYDYAKLTKAITDEDRYLVSLGEVESTQVVHVNLTDQEDDVVTGWMEKIRKDLDDHYLYKKYRTRNPFLKKIIHFVGLVDLYIRRKMLLKGILRKLKLLFVTVFNIKREKAIIKRSYVQFKKAVDVNFEDFLKSADTKVVNRDIALKKINERIGV